MKPKLNPLPNILFNYWWLPLLLVWLVISRFWGLGRLPATMTHDEMVYAAQAKSLAVQGATLDGSLSWFSLQPVDPMYAEWPASFVAVGFWLSNHPLWATHFVSALMGLLLPFGLAWLSYGVWRSKKLAIATLFIASLTPLHWQLSRLMLDAWYSGFFYVWGGALLLTGSSVLVALSLPLFVVGFFGYQGFKLLLLPWIAVLLGLRVTASLKWQLKSAAGLFEHVRQHITRYQLGVLAGCLVLVLWYGFWLMPQQDVNNRLHWTIFSDTTITTQRVNDNRRLSLDNPYLRLIDNRYNHIAFFLSQRLVAALNPQLLFLTTDSNVSGFTVWTHGVFYSVEGALLVLGFLWLLHHRHYRWSGIVAVAGTVVLLLPTLINTQSEWHIMRSGLSYMLMMMIMAWGATQWWRWKLGRGVLIGLYGVSILHFGYHYAYRLPVMSLDFSNFNEYQVARYIQLSLEKNPDQPVVFHTGQPKSFFISYLVYANALNHETASQVVESFRTNHESQQKNYSLGLVTFTDACFDFETQNTELYEVGHLNCRHQNAVDPTILSDKKTASDPATLSIPSVSDSGEKFRILNDRLCGDYTLGTFVHPTSLHQLNLLELTSEEFCTSWVTDLAQFDSFQ